MHIQIKATLAAGPFSNTPAYAVDRQLHAAMLATIAMYAGERLDEAGLAKQFVEAILRYSRDEAVPVKVAAGRAAARLALSNRAMMTSEWQARGSKWCRGRGDCHQ